MESGTTSPAMELRKTALNGMHRRLGAKMVNFGGWDMPVEYPSSGGLIAEHKAVRSGVGVFDVSHMGDIRIRSGSRPGGALAAVQHISMNDASRLAIGQAHYSAMLYPEGTFVDDVIVHRLGEDDYLLVINAGTREKDINWVRENTRHFDCVVEDLSDACTQLAIQGPRAADVLRKLTDADLSSVKNYWFTHGTVCGLNNTLIARTGYTGEDGFEIYVPSSVPASEMVWSKVLEAGREFGIVPCGLGARNTLRLEAKMALYGHEISETINVWEAGLDRYCKIEKGDFIGRAALEKAKAAGLARTLAGLEMIERGIARDGYACFNERGERVGVVTSGSPSPTLCKNIALAYLPPAMAAPGTPVYVEIRGQKCKAQVVPTPFYKRPKPLAQQSAPKN
ncbi:MAG TPA: glycine cleavage system aminomethyltransferase GcvT [Candidatus Acidoferrum sp.]|jgi:aminomethyltransferase|nr:glycine cleavage system aminomethyltransferase GcvT [Candidatus Acidoferrum sp.]